MSNWLFGFFTICLLSFLGVGCASTLVNQAQPSIPGAWSYTHLATYTGQDTQVWPVYVDQDFSYGEGILIQQALDQWNVVLNGHARFQVVDSHFDMREDVLKQAVEGKAFLILRVTADNRIVHSVDSQHNVLGVTPDIGMHWIHLVGSRLQYPPEFRFVTMHELGHALGANHTDGGLMNAEYDYTRDDTQCIDYKAMEQVAKWYHWEVSTLNYCYWDTKAHPVTMDPKDRE